MATELPEECPVCNRPIPDDYFELLRANQGDFLPAEKICVVDFPNLVIVHIEDETKARQEVPR